VGYFGLGFLTAYVVADKVEFITTSYQDEKQGWRFVSKGGQRYQLEATTPCKIGSTVVLHLKDAFEDLAETEFIHAIIRKYCCLLPIDIYLNACLDDADDEPVNRIEVPWRLPQECPELRRQKSSLAFAQIFDNSFEPLVTFPIVGTQECPVNGLLWIQDGAHYATSDNRVTTIFIRSMHITDECKLLLPRWAGFVGCVIDTPLLKPTASRESVQEDEGFEKIRQLINKTLVEALTETAQESGPIWRRISSRHNESLLGAAISDQQHL
jgi:molecular chaperone HtpG